MNYAELQKNTHPKTDIPSFLIEAQNAVNQGDNNKAKKLLTDSAADKICRIKEHKTKILSLYLLSALFFKIRDFEKAEKWNRKILEFGQYGFAYYELSKIFQEKCDFATAADFAQKALALDPENPKLMSMLGNLFINTSKTEQGIDLLRKALSIAPEDNLAASSMLYNLHYKHDIAPQTLFNEHLQWAKNHAPEMNLSQHTNTASSDKKLRIGYVSPNFNQHSAAYFFEPVLETHNRDQFEIYGYNNSTESDKVTKRMRPQFKTFCDIYNLSDEQVAELIRHHEIDILVDLAGHTAGGRLSVFALKPTPIQLTWLGYPDTTGLPQIDYRITDELADPPCSHIFYTEKQICLPCGFLCYRPPDFSPPVTNLPALKNGCITFGSFNINGKINFYISDIWAQILKHVDNSRLILKIRGGQHPSMRQYYQNIFEQYGISKERIEIFGHLSPVEHLKLYGQIDIALDTYPYQGTTTTCEAIWMGVPVISLTGQCHCSRVSSSILKRLDMDFFTASNQDEYIKKACALAAKPQALSKIRLSMRQRMAASDLCNKTKFTTNLEMAYRQIWRQWCKNRKNR